MAAGEEVWESPKCRLEPSTVAVVGSNGRPTTSYLPTRGFRLVMVTRHDKLQHPHTLAPKPRLIDPRPSGDVPLFDLLDHDYISPAS